VFLGLALDLAIHSALALSFLEVRMTSSIGEAMIRHLELMGRLTEEDKKALLGLKGNVRDLQRGEDVLVDGERPPYSVVVLSGLLQRYTLTLKASGRSTPSTSQPTPHVWKPSILA
jgi:CRP-like cAMP-binding protein